MYKRLFKRLLDIIMSVVLMIITFPITVVVLVLLTVQNKGNPFFLQMRPGKNQRPFTIYKFKTMSDAKDSEGNLLPDNDRMSVVGRWVRKLSLDELPQLVNVLIGNMSMIGPRPLLFKYIPLYTVEQNRRHEVKPGITGLAQVNGRNALAWEKKFELDVYYVDNLSFLMDVKIILLTILKVVRMDGVNQSSDRPMQPFRGINQDQ